MHIAATPLEAPKAALKSRPIPSTFLERILAPYQPTGTDYLRSAKVIQLSSLVEEFGDATGPQAPIITTQGQYSIPSSCYIQSTGHFNAVEFLICYNQLAYATFGQLIAEGTLASLHEERASSACHEQLKRLSMDLFLEKQLSSMFILKTSSRFKRVIDPNDFHCRLSVDSVFYRHGTLFTHTSCEFGDRQGGGADGSIMLAYPLNQS